MEALALTSALTDILIVESNPAEARLIAEGFLAAGHTRKIDQIHSAEEAMSFLRCEPPHQNAPVPDLIILDLSLPKRSGFDLLQEIRATRSLRYIPILIFTGSVDPTGSPAGVRFACERVHPEAERS